LIVKGVYSGKLYRALNPAYARESLSGEGAKRYGERFTPRDASSLFILAALCEANQVGSLEPTLPHH
jgi:RES domain-containing protein